LTSSFVRRVRSWELFERPSSSALFCLLCGVGGTICSVDVIVSATKEETNPSDENGGSRGSNEWGSAEEQGYKNNGSLSCYSFHKQISRDFEPNLLIIFSSFSEGLISII